MTKLIDRPAHPNFDPRKYDKKIKTKPSNQKYRAGWERIFEGKNNK